MPIQPQSNRQAAAPHLAAAAQQLRAQNPQGALPFLREAARLLPAEASVQHDFGLACLQCGHIPQAIAALRRAITINPGYADAHLRLAIALEAAGAFDDALAAYARAATDPACAGDAAYREASLLDSLGRTGAAIAAYRRAEAAWPDTMLGGIAAARAALADNAWAEAEERLRAILAQDGANPIALDLLGNLLADTGRFEEARATLLHAIERAPQHAGSYYDVARCRKMTAEDAGLVARMRAALDSPELDATQRARLHLALAKAAADGGDPAESMRHADAASALRDGFAPFDAAGFEARVDRLIAHFTAAECARAAAHGCDDATPILILGLPRSGTTLAEQILSAHPDVAAGGELPFWNERGLAWEPAAAAGQWPEMSISDAAGNYRRGLRAISTSAAHVTDKMPLNFQWAGLIHAAFPRATLIHIRRIPADTALSIHQTHFNPRMAFPTGGAALVRYMAAYQRLCAHWRNVLPPDRFIEIDYEALVAEPGAVIRHLLAACGLPFHAACLSPERNQGAIRTPSKFQARQPITCGAIGKFRTFAPYFGALSPLLPGQQA